MTELVLLSELDRTEPRLDAASPQVVLKAVSRRLGSHQALDGISFTIDACEIVGIIGRSGAGKSTLIRCLNGLERVDHGSIIIEQTDITKLSDAALQRVRQRIGMVFQHFNLLSAKTVAENVALPLLIAGADKRARAKRVTELLDLVGLSAHARRYPGQLSGGQRQRVGIARALAASPALLLCDEATSALDPETTTSILNLLDDINRRLGVTIVLITHEMSVIRSLARHVIVMDHGRVLEEGTVAEVFATPRSEVAQSLLRGLRPELPPQLARAVRLAPFAGGVPLIRVDLVGADARTSLLSDLADAFGVKSWLLHGGIDDVHGVAIGTLFFTFAPAKQSVLPDVIAFVSARSKATKHLGYVAASS
jgi:D-methionine transport system ATP-binding protein